jgi:hypothetical protein
MGKVLGFLSIVITMAIGMYIYSQQVKPVATGVGSVAPEEFATVTGVKNDLISIANAERGALASEGKYVSLDELISGHYLSVPMERPPYVYAVEVNSGSFRATATRTTKGTPAQLLITENMQVQVSE